jgi:hypothetical protein
VAHLKDELANMTFKEKQQLAGEMTGNSKDFPTV